MDRSLRFVHLFPELLNLYADHGNMAVLVGRARARGFAVETVAVRLGTELRIENADLVLLGGGSDREQVIVGKELTRYREDLLSAIDRGLPVLAVCGGYQLLGEYYELPNGERVPGLRVLEMTTRAGRNRLIGNVAIEWREGGERKTIIGFENHGGRTTHEYPPLGTVIKGFGNNGRDGKEGVLYKGIVGTYIHGPLLPKNPHVADRLIRAALRYRGQDDTLSALADDLEWRVHDAVLRQICGEK